MVGRETKALSLCIGWLVLQWVRIPHGSCIALYFPPGNVRCPSLCHWVVAGVRGKKLLCILAHSRSTFHLDRIGLFRDQLMHNQTDRGMRLHPKIKIMYVIALFNHLSAGPCLVDQIYPWQVVPIGHARPTWWAEKGMHKRPENWFLGLATQYAKSQN